jgi:hypothetical protein
VADPSNLRVFARLIDQSGNISFKHTEVKTTSGVSLSSQQKTLVSSVLDLFSGDATKEKLQLWNDDGEFEDPLCIARGRTQFEAQFYGLKTAFSEIEQLSHEVTSAGNPIRMNLSQRYKVKGIGTEKTISSVIEIKTTEDQSKIVKVQDNWSGEAPPSGAIQDVSIDSSDNMNIATNPHRHSED